MGYFDKITKAFSGTSQKAQNYAEISRLQKQIAENEDKIQPLYADIGEQYCEMYGENPDISLRSLVSVVQELKQQNAEMEEQINALRGIGICPVCGESVDLKWAFCQHCGAKLSRQQPEQEEAKEEGPLVCKCGHVFGDDDLFCINCGTSREQLLKERQTVKNEQFGGETRIEQDKQKE